MTVFEWKYKDGWIWIAKDDDGYRVWIDPDNYEWFYLGLKKEDWHELRVVSADIHNTMSNCEASDAAREAVIAAWQRMGSPQIDRTTPEYVAPTWVGSLNSLEAKQERAARWNENNPTSIAEGL